MSMMRTDLTALSYGGAVLNLPAFLSVERWEAIEDQTGKSGRPLIISLLEMNPSDVRAVIEVADPALDFDAVAAATPLAALARAALAPLLGSFYGELEISEAAVLRALTWRRL
jgi:hypothetical protein